MHTNIKSFASNLDDLRDFVNLLAPVLTERQQNQVKEDAPHLVPLMLAFAELDHQFLQIDDAARAQLKAHLTEQVQITKDQVSGTVSIQTTGDLSRSFAQAMDRLKRGLDHIGLLYRSALISLVSAAEWYISRLLHTYYEKFPDAAGVSEKAFSLEDLKQLGSIEEARKYLIDLKVEDVLRGSFDDWLGFFRSKPKLSMGYLEADRDAIAEVFQRRNLVIHNGAIVNRHYISKVPEAYRTGLTIGSEIKVSREYLDQAISVFEKNFILIGAELWKKMDPDDDGRGTVLLGIAFKNLTQERWSIAEGLSYFTAHDARMSEKDKMIGKVNYWQCLKWQGRFDEVQTEVESEDTTAKERIYRLAKHALLDEDGPFSDLLSDMLESKEISVEDAKTWPLFRMMRSTGRVKELLSLDEPSEGSSVCDISNEIERSADNDIA